MSPSTSDRHRIADKTVWRVGYGAMRLAGDGLQGPPLDRGEALAVLRAAIDRGMPVLGVCLGLQAIGEVMGATVTHAPHLMHGKTSSIEHDGSGVFAGLASPLTATRYHSLCLDPPTIPATLRITARSEDGVVQGVAHRDRPVHGVQFHPESVLSESGEQIVANFFEHVHASTGSA